MKKQTSKKSEVKVLKEVVEQCVEQIVANAETAQEAPKKRKMVEFNCNSSNMTFATEKAQLLIVHNAACEEVKIWLSKALSHFVADGDEPGIMTCRIPAWLYYKTGLNNYFPVTRWSQATV